MAQMVGQPVANEKEYMAIALHSEKNTCFCIDQVLYFFRLFEIVRFKIFTFHIKLALPTERTTMRAFVPFLNTPFMEGMGAIQLTRIFVYFIETDYTDHALFA